MPMWTHNKYSRRLKHLSLRMPPCIPFFINNYQFVPRCTIFLSLHVLCAMLGVSRSVLFLLSFALFPVVTSQTLAYSFEWERYMLRLNQNSSQDLHAFSFSCELFFFFSQLLLCLVVVLQFYRAFLLPQVELSIGCMFYLVREFACCTEFCVLTRKQVVEVAILFAVVTSNSFEVLT